MPRDTEQDYATFESLGITLESPNAAPVPIRTWTCALETTFKPEEPAFSWTQLVRVGSQVILLRWMLQSHFIPWAGYQWKRSKQKGHSRGRYFRDIGACWSQGSAEMQLTTRSRVESLRQSVAKRKKGGGETSK